MHCERCTEPRFAQYLLVSRAPGNTHTEVVCWDCLDEEEDSQWANLAVFPGRELMAERNRITRPMQQDLRTHADNLKLLGYL